MDTQSTNIGSGSSSFSGEPQEFKITQNAAKQVATLLAKEPAGFMLRLSVAGGGCSGFQYKYDFIATSNDDDVLFKRGDAAIVVDSISLGFLKNSVLDYVETLGAAEFQVKNPNATATCGCGNSFAV